MLVTAATGSTECFPSGRNERYFVAIWTLITNCVKPSSIRWNNEIASVRVQLLLRKCAGPQRRAFLAAWVRLNAIGLIALSRLRPLRVFSGSDRRTLRQNSFLASELMRILVKL